jgi:alpha-N-acetylglucosaminidase
MLTLCVLLAATAAAAASRTALQQEDAVRQLLQRRLPDHADEFDLAVVPADTPPGAAPAQSFSVAAGSALGRIALTGSSGVALASALNHYLKYDANIQINVWFTSQTTPAGLAVGGTAAASTLPPPTAVNISSPYTFQNYLNICAFGYSTAWYSWSRWQAEIDWWVLPRCWLLPRCQLLPRCRLPAALRPLDQLTAPLPPRC